MSEAISQNLLQLQQSITSLSFQEKLWLLGQIVQQLQSAEPIESNAAEGETAYLLRSSENARRLLESIAQLKAGTDLFIEDKAVLTQIQLEQSASRHQPWQNKVSE